MISHKEAEHSHYAVRHHGARLVMILHAQRPKESKRCRPSCHKMARVRAAATAVLLLSLLCVQDAQGLFGMGKGKAGKGEKDKAGEAPKAAPPPARGPAGGGGSQKLSSKGPGGAPWEDEVRPPCRPLAGCATFQAHAAQSSLSVFHSPHGRVWPGKLGGVAAAAHQRASSLSLGHMQLSA